MELKNREKQQERVRNLCILHKSGFITETKPGTVILKLIILPLFPSLLLQ